MNNVVKKIVVFYRDYSNSLESYLAADSCFSFSKDGLQQYLNHKVPRLSVFVTTIGNPVEDKKRLKNLDSFLASQVKLGLIVSYS